MVVSNRFDLNDIDQFAKDARADNLSDFSAIGGIAHDMAHSKNLARVINSSLNLDAVLDTRGHGFLAEDVIPLCGKRNGDLCVQMILNGNQDRICKPLSNGIDGLCRSDKEVFPSMEDEGAVDLVENCKVGASLGTRLCNGNNLAALRTAESILGIRLAALTAADYSKSKRELRGARVVYGGRHEIPDLDRTDLVMARILPRLVGRLERQGKQQTVFPFRAPKRKRQSLFTPPLPPPSFRPADHPQTILLSHNIHYVRHKSRPPSLSQPQISASVPPDPPRQMTPAEFAWWSNPYLRMLSTPLRLCIVTQRHLPSDLLIRLVGMQVPPTRLPSGKRSVAKLVPDGVLHPKFTNRKVSGGSYVLCWRKAVEQLERGGYKRLSPDLSLYPNLMHHIAHLLRLRVLQEFRLLADSLWFAVRTHQRLGIPNPILRRLTREEWGLMRTTGSLPYQNAVAVLIVPPVNKDVTTKRRPTPSFSSLPPQDEHCPPTLPPTSTLLDSSVKSPNDLPDAISSLQIPLYNSVSAFPSRSQRAALHSLLLRILDAERYLKYLHLQRGESFSEKTSSSSKSSHAFILCSDMGSAKRGDPAAVARALWRLRMYDSEGWSGSLL